MSPSFCGSGIWAQLKLKTLGLSISHEAAIEVSTRVGVSSSDSTGKGATSYLTYVDVGRIHVLKGHWTESVGSLLTVGCTLPSFLPGESLQFDNLILKPARESCNKMEARMFSNLTTEVTSPCCCQILLARSNILKGRGLQSVTVGR